MLSKNLRKLGPYTQKKPFSAPLRAYRPIQEPLPSTPVRPPYPLKAYGEVVVARLAPPSPAPIVVRTLARKKNKREKKKTTNDKYDLCKEGTYLKGDGSFVSLCVILER
jgi:hypothetical protein